MRHRRPRTATLHLGARRRRGRALPALLAVVAAGVAAVAVVGASTTAPPATAVAPKLAGGAAPEDAEAEIDVGDGPAAPVGDAASGAGEADVAAQDPDPLTPPLARLGELELWSPGEDPVVVGYHEAAHVSAAAVTPVGSLIEDHNTTRTDLPDDDPAGLGYLVMSSRGRAAGPTSAIDVVLREGTEVRSPVTGTVTDVRTYVLYGAHEDERIEIVPDARPDLRLVMIHVGGAQVEVGDRVVGGVTVVAATARIFPFGSHIDRETEPDRHPHVHLELQPVDRPRPGDDLDADGAGDDDPDAEPDAAPDADPDAGAPDADGT